MASPATTVLILAALWVPPALAMIVNRLDPDIGTALGVPYGFLAGFLLAIIVTGVVAALSQRWAALRPSYMIVLGGAALSIGLLFLADRGILSATS
ncbi:MAG: hypothetical protein AAF346_04375 [Pseudomonadota bacterium]